MLDNSAPGVTIPRNLFDITSMTNIMAIIALTLQTFFPWLFAFNRIWPDALNN